MDGKKFTVEELMLDEGFLDYCLHEDSAYRPYWEYMIESNADHKSVFEKAANNISLLGGNLCEKEILQQFKKVRARLQPGKKTGMESTDLTLINKPGQPEQAIRQYRFFLKKNFLYTAAIVATLCIGTYTLPALMTKEKAHALAIAETVYNSKPGERKKIELPDGTQVFLNTNSEVRIKSDFNSTTREVALTGEAFFQVAKNPSKPFIVKSNDFATTALGTSFYVYARRANESYAVDLLEGKVKLSDKGRSNVTLVAGEEANWTKVSSQFTKTNFNTTELQQWLTGKITFNNTSLYNAIRILEKWYAVDIEIRNKSITQKSITGEYDNMALDDVLKVICFSLSCKYAYVNDTVIIE